MEDQIRQRPMEESINQRQQSPAINDEYASTTYGNRKSAYLLTVEASLTISNMADSVNDQTTIDK